MMHGVLTCTTI
uniref:Uncharacterized protein n=1 Tax=Arundo donax TaxID=35708 RepID=A0A0A9EQJ9_ARUDO